MANDRYGRSDSRDYDYGRRLSLHPNLTWQRDKREPSPPRRPQPQRSHSNMERAPNDPRRPSEAPAQTASKDPRLEARAQAQKRQASRSPDGGQPRKQVRAEDATVAVTANVVADPRRASVPNGALTGTRRPSIERRASGVNGATTNSPLRHNGVSSGQSTPQHATHKPSTASHTQIAPVAPMHIDTETLDPVSDALLNFAVSTADLSKAEVKLQEVQLRLERARKEFTMNENQFKAFPVIMEKKTTAKERAKREVERVSREVSEYEATQQAQMQKLGRIISTAIQAKPDVSTKDFVSRQEYDELKEELAHFKQEIRSSMRSVQDEAASSKEFRDEAETRLSKVDDLANLRTQVDEHDKLYDELVTWKQNTETTIDELKTSTKDLPVLRSNCGTLFEWKTKDVTPAIGQVKSLRIDLDRVSSQHTALKQEVTALQNKNQTSKDNDEVKRIISGAVAKAEQMEKTQNERFASKKDHIEVQEIQDRQVQQIADLRKSVNRLADAGTSPRANWRTPPKTKDVVMKDHVHDEGNSGLVARVEKLESSVEGLSLQAPSSGPAIEERVSELEKRSSLLEDGMNSMKEIEDAVIEHAEAVIKDAADEVRSGLSNNVASIEQVRQAQTQAEERILAVEEAGSAAKQAHDSMKLRLDEVQTMLGSKASIESVNILKADVTAGRTSDLNKQAQEMQALKEQVQQVQQQQRQSMQVQRVPTPVQAQHQQQQRPLAQQSPHLQNGRLPSSPLANGVMHSPQLPPGQAQVPMMSDRSVMIEDRFDALVFAYNHLKSRYDNLTTDEMVRRIIGQLETVWPHLKNFEARFQPLQEGCQELKKRLGQLKSELDGLKDTLKTSVDNVRTETKTGLDELRKLIIGVQSKLPAIEAALKTDKASTVKNEAAQKKAIDDVWKELNAYKDTATEAYELATKHNGDLEGVDLTNLASRINSGEGTMVRHQQDLKKCLDALKEAAGLSVKIEEIEKLCMKTKAETDQMGEEVKELSR